MGHGTHVLIHILRKGGWVSILGAVAGGLLVWRGRDLRHPCPPEPLPCVRGALKWDVVEQIVAAALLGALVGLAVAFVLVALHPEWREGLHLED